MDNDKIALQLYTLRELTSQDMLGTLREVAAQGYRLVEFAGFGGVPTEEIRAELDSLGMRAISLHIGLDNLQTNREQTLSDIQTLGCEYAVVAYVAEERRRTREQVEEIAARFNNYGALCRDAGVRFAYHNHNFEFAPLDGNTIFDILVKETDSDLVAFELDVYWARYAGEDPVEVIDRLARRVPLLHAKDMAEDEMSRMIDAPVGEGILPWPEILTASERAGVEYYVIEQDHPRNPLSDTYKSLKCLRQLLNE